MSSAQGQARASDDSDLGARIQAELDRALQRNIKGLEYLTSPSPLVGTTPKDLVHSRGTLNLYRYRPLSEEVYRVPLLLVMATTNKGYIFDLAPGRSLVEYLLRAGYDVFAIDWSPPRAEERHLNLETYVTDFIPDCIGRVQALAGEEHVSLVGYCMGGVLSVMAAAIHRPGPIKNLACFTTPIDWEHMKLFRAWSDPRYFELDRLVDTFGNIPPEIVLTSFEMLRPATRVAGQVQLWERMWSDEYVRSYRMFDRWATDPLPVAGEYFRDTIKELLWNNRLLKGDLRLGGERVDLARIRIPLFHAMAQHDHIVPYEAAEPLVRLAGAEDKTEIVLKGGHVSVVAGPNAVKRMWPALDAWLGERSE